MITAVLTERRFLSVREAEAIYGLSQPHLRRLIASGAVRSYRPAGTRRVLIERQSLDLYITGAEPPTA
jgi:excisionase family DNA binding protein